MSTTNSINLNSNGVVTYNNTTGVFTGSSLTQHDVLVAGSANNLVSVTPSTAGLVLTSNGVSSDPSFQSVSAAGGITTIDGDSGSMTPTAGVVTISGGTTGLTTTASSSTMDLTGTLIVANGGSGALTLTGVLTGNGTSPFTASAVTQHDVLVGGATNAIVSVSPSTSGFVLTSNGVSADPSFQALPASTQAQYINVTGTTQSMVVDTFYIANNAGLVTFTPPATCAVGTVFAVQGSGAGGWTIDLTAHSQTFNFGSTPGTTSVASSNRYDGVQFVCATANTVFTLINGVGNPAVS